MTTGTRSLELRTYVASPDKRDALPSRFRDHTTTLFEKHGMENLGYWVALDGDGEPTETLIYVLAHDSRVAAKESWAAFYVDHQREQRPPEAHGLRGPRPRPPGLKPPQTLILQPGGRRLHWALQSSDGVVDLCFDVCTGWQVKT
jgi:hypothetical protein